MAALQPSPEEALVDKVLGAEQPTGRLYRGLITALRDDADTAEGLAAARKILKALAARAPALAEALLANDTPRQTPDRSAILAVAAPAFTDLLQTALAQAGLLFVSSSTYQMTRGSVVVFTCILSVRWLKQKLRPHHYVAVAVVCAAVALVGVAGRFGEKGHTSLGSYVLGLGLIVVGQAVGALQFCLEEHLMVERGLSPVVLVGWEGLWGVLYFVILAPVLSLTPDSDVAAAALWHEDFAETFDQLAHSGDLIALTLASARRPPLRRTGAARALARESAVMPTPFTNNGAPSASQTAKPRLMQSVDATVT